jgi:hypothetical protein
MGADSSPGWRISCAGDPGAAADPHRRRSGPGAASGIRLSSSTCTAPSSSARQGISLPFEIRLSPQKARCPSRRSWRACCAITGVPHSANSPRLPEAVAVEHASRSPAEPYPEVVAERLWAGILGILEEDALAFAAAWEASTNKVALCPGQGNSCAPCALGRDFSSASCPSPGVHAALFPLLLGDTIEGFGFDPGLVLFSWREGLGKPSPALFDSLVGSLATKGLGPEQAIFVGNDMLKDMYPLGGPVCGLACSRETADPSGCGPTTPAVPHSGRRRGVPGPASARRRRAGAIAILRRSA